MQIVAWCKAALCWLISGLSLLLPLGRWLLLESFVPLEYSYYITAGNLADIREAWNSINAL